LPASLLVNLYYRERRRKERSKSKAKAENGNETLSLLEKLQLAMEKCEGKFFNKNIVNN
jgi:phosphopantothenate synthetase